MGKKKKNFKFSKLPINRGRTREEIRIERFIVEQIDKYIKLHKEHEKDLDYIG
jgi:hypothetical protein